MTSRDAPLPISEPASFSAVAFAKATAVRSFSFFPAFSLTMTYLVAAQTCNKVIMLNIRNYLHFHANKIIVCFSRLRSND